MALEEAHDAVASECFSFELLTSNICSKTGREIKLCSLTSVKMANYSLKMKTYVKIVHIVR